jgi:hypothetical protein
MTNKPLFILLLVLISFSAACAEKDTKPPRVVSTSPTNGSRDVNPSINEISVTFDKETKNVLPVKLEPNKEYIIWINSMKHKNFKDKSGNSSIPFKFTFKTR